MSLLDFNKWLTCCWPGYFNLHKRCYLVGEKKHGENIPRRPGTKPWAVRPFSWSSWHHGWDPLVWVVGGKGSWNPRSFTGQFCLIFTPKIGEDSHVDWYFSKGLKPPTSFVFVSTIFMTVTFSHFSIEVCHVSSHTLDTLNEFKHVNNIQVTILEYRYFCLKKQICYNATFLYVDSVSRFGRYSHQFPPFHLPPLGGWDCPRWGHCKKMKPVSLLVSKWSGNLCRVFSTKHIYIYI